MEESIIKAIFTINDDWYTNVRFKGSYKKFISELEESNFVRIYDNNREIYLNTNHIASFELGDD